MSNPRGRPSRIDREQVVAAATELFEQGGFAQTTMQDVADAAGISRKALFLHFPSKGDLVWHRAGPYVESLRADLAAAAQANSSQFGAVLEAVAAGFRNAPESADTRRRQSRLYASDPQVRAVIEAKSEAWRSPVSEYLRACGTPDLYADMLAYGYWRALWNGLEAWSADGGDVREVLRKQFAPLDEAARLLTGG